MFTLANVCVVYLVALHVKNVSSLLVPHLPFFCRFFPLFNPICQSKCYPSGKCFQNKTWFRFFFDREQQRNTGSCTRKYCCVVVWCTVLCINNAWMFLQRFYFFFRSCSKRLALSSSSVVRLFNWSRGTSAKINLGINNRAWGKSVACHIQATLFCVHDEPQNVFINIKPNQGSMLNGKKE